MALNKSLIKAIIILPINVLVVIPGVLLFFFKSYPAMGSAYPFSMVIYLIAVVLAVLSITLMLWTVLLFTKKGNGTPAPWDPPKKFIVLGPYRYVRNPMLIGVISFLLSEAIIFGSLPIFIMLVCFLIINMLYFPLVEEKDLEKRFGNTYLEYKKNVPRWIPRLRPYGK